MSVIINELEVVAQPQSREQMREALKEEQPRVPGPTPHDIQAVLVRFIERRRRLRAS
jgi:hypothetical protein